MEIIWLIIVFLILSGGVAAMVFTFKLSKKGELKEKMTDHEAKVMAGATLEHRVRPPLFEKTFGNKKTLASASYESSVSWKEIGQAIQNGQFKKLWSIVFMTVIFCFIVAIFLLF